MKKPLIVLVLVTALLTFATPAPAQLYVPGEPAPPLLEVTEDGKLIYGGDVAYECESVGSGIVMPAPNSSPETRAELQRTNEKAVKLCTEAGFPPAGGGTVSEDLAADEEGNLAGPPSPPLEVKRDGTLVVGGDVYLAGYCGAYVEHPAQTNSGEREYVEACEKAGFSPAEGDVLPETGGTRPATVLAAAGLILAGSGLALARAG